MSSGALFIIWEILLKSKIFDESWKSSPKFVDPSHHQHKFDESWRRALQKWASDSIKNVKCWRRTLHFWWSFSSKLSSSKSKIFNKLEESSQIYGSALPSTLNLWMGGALPIRGASVFIKKCKSWRRTLRFWWCSSQLSYLQKSRFFISWRSSQIYGSAPPSTSNCWKTDGRSQKEASDSIKKAKMLDGRSDFDDRVFQKSWFFLSWRSSQI